MNVMNPSDITAIIAIVISIISATVSGVFSFLQYIHNRKSLKPIPALKLSDCEDELAVKLENVGAGPLTIKTLRFKKAGEEQEDGSPVLVEMMPEIAQDLDPCAGEAIDGWTILVGAEIVILKIHQKADDGKTWPYTRKLVREALSELTGYLKYTDVYGTEFDIYSRSLGYFGRTLEK